MNSGPESRLQEYRTTPSTARLRYVAIGLYEAEMQSSMKLVP